MVGDINTLAPIVTMPFLLTYACIDYSYFALAQTFDIQTKREERYRIQAQSPLYETRSYGATIHNDYQENDLDQLFPERTRHKNLSSPESTPYHQQRPSEAQLNHDGTNHAQNNQDEVIIRDPSISSTFDGETEADNEPIAPIRPPIHQKTKNWYSGLCNRWASLMGVCLSLHDNYAKEILFSSFFQGWHKDLCDDPCQLGFRVHLYHCGFCGVVLGWNSKSSLQARNC